MGPRRHITTRLCGSLLHSFRCTHATKAIHGCMLLKNTDIGIGEEFTKKYTWSDHFDASIRQATAMVQEHRYTVSSHYSLVESAGRHPQLQTVSKISHNGLSFP